MRIYYRAPDAVVTSDHFVHRTAATTEAFLVRDLRDVCISEPRRTSRIAPFIVGGALLALAVTAPLWQLSKLYAIGALGVAGLVIAGGVMVVRSRPRRVLQGTYRGAVVTLYESTDARVFNQVSRALRRAVENRRPPRSSDDFTAA
jgi:hypothetical protein